MRGFGLESFTNFNKLLGTNFSPSLCIMSNISLFLPCMVISMTEHVGVYIVLQLVFSIVYTVAGFKSWL